MVRWEEGKKWQAKLEKMRTSLKEKERENESVSKQLGTLKELYARSVVRVVRVYIIYFYIYTYIYI